MSASARDEWFHQNKQEWERVHQKLKCVKNWGLTLGAGAGGFSEKH